ncbi:MAG: V-type ATP synthase subunit K [Methanomicrobiales archaeon]
MPVGMGNVLVLVGAGLAVGLSAIGAGIGVGIAGAAAAGVTAVREERFGMALVFQALPQTQGIYGLLTAILLLIATGMLGGAGIEVPLAIGFAAVGCGLAVGMAGLSAIGQGIASAAGISAAEVDTSTIGRSMVFSVLPETQAIYGLLVAILIMAFTGMFTGVFDATTAVGLAAVGCGLAVGVAGLSGIGQGIAASGGIGATAEKGEMFGRGLVFSVLPETQAIYGLLVAILIMAFTGMFTGVFDATTAVGLAAVGCGLAVGVAGLSGIGQGIAASGGIGATAEKGEMFGRGLVFSVLPETQAIYGLLVAILIMAFAGMFTGAFDLTVAMGVSAIGAGIAVGVAGLSGIGQGITAGAGIMATSRRSEMMGRALIFAVMSETFAIFGLLVAILIMFGIGLIGG